MFGNSVVCLVWYVWHGVVCLGCGVMCCVYMQLGAEGKGRRLEEGVGWGWGVTTKQMVHLEVDILDIPNSDHCPSCLILPLQTHTVHQSDSVSFIQLSTSQDTLCFIQHCLCLLYTSDAADES